MQKLNSKSKYLFLNKPLPLYLACHLDLTTGKAYRIYDSFIYNDFGDKVNYEFWILDIDYGTIIDGSKIMELLYD